MTDSLFVTVMDGCIAALSFLITAYIYLRVSILPISKYYKNKFIIILATVLIAVIYAFLSYNSLSVALLIAYLFPSLFFIVFEKNNRRLKCIVAFLSSTLTRIVSLCAMILISIIASLVIPEIQPEQKVMVGQLTLVIVQILSFILVFFLFKIKRFKKGFQFFQNEKNMGIGLAISGVLFIYFGITYTYQVKTYFLAMIGFVGVFISSIGIYLWIRRSITVHYRQRLQLQSEEHYQQLLAESEAKNEELMKSNEFLAKLVHRDNHLINALNTSIDDYFNSDDKEFKDNLFREIQTLAKERGELLAQEQSTLKLLPSTGNRLIDGAINNFYIKATAHGIDFDLAVTEPVDTIIGKYISQTELQTLLCDHIKDAIIAVVTKGEGRGKILVNLSVKYDNYEITIFDSGVDFEVDTLSKLGRERVTTHADNGGSGIGFMTTFETLKKAYASLIITEIENKTPFSKSVSFRFDGLSSFVIQSYRADELKSAINREDTIIV